MKRTGENENAKRERERKKKSFLAKEDTFWG